MLTYAVEAEEAVRASIRKPVTQLRCPASPPFDHGHYFLISPQAENATMSNMSNKTTMYRLTCQSLSCHVSSNMLLFNHSPVLLTLSPKQSTAESFD